ncbi:MAG: hypothetical protein M9962_00140 [Oligoflexia bacterium]|nr:hypothetical protein [Oligoflexia bacterium]
MTFRKKVFVSQKIAIRFGAHEVKVQALVSPFGAKYVFEDSDIPQELRLNLGKEVQVFYKNVPTKARLVREVNSIGVLYNIRFLNPSGLFLRQIERDIRENGIPSPWIRSLPRLVSDTKNAPSPAICVLFYRGETHILSIKNFTLGGLLLEFAGEGLSEIRIGEKIEFDIVTNYGEKISDVVAKISHFTLERGVSEDIMEKMQIGVQFLSMSMLSESKYKTTIREHCRELKLALPQN